MVEAQASQAPYATLANVLGRPGGPVPPALAVALVVAVARALEGAAAGRTPGIAPAQIALGRNGAVGLVPAPIPPAYVSPEEAAGQPPGPRAEVFALGAVAWELLAGRPLFTRADTPATRQAVASDPVPSLAATLGVPSILDDVLASALAKSPERRFDNVAAFARALSGARAAAGLDEPTASDLAAFVAARIPRPSSAAWAAATPAGAVPDLDLPGMGAAQRRSSGSLPAALPQGSPSSMRMAATRPTTAPGVGEPSVPSVRSAAAAAFGGLELELPVPSAPKISVAPVAPVALRPSSAPSIPSPPVAPSSVPAHGIAFDAGNDDDFDMQIERNMSAPAISTATSGRPSGMHGPTSSRPSLSGTGLELGAPQRLSARSRPAPRAAEIGVFGTLVGFLVALLLAGGAAAALVRFVHRDGGRILTSFFPHAFDGSSANESGAVALVTLVVAAAVIFVGLRLRPHAWWIVGAGGALLLLALAMVTVTLASTGDNPTPPDGVLLVPYLAPLALLLLGLGMIGRAARTFTHARAARKLGAVATALLAGALLFAAIELGPLAAYVPLLPR